MKTTTLLIAIALLFTGTTFATGTIGEPPTVKLLPVSQDDILRLVVANDSDENVKIKFYNNGGIVAQDKIKSNDYDKGFFRSYDLKNLEPGNYSIEVSSNGTSVKYDIQIMNNRKVWATYWNNYMKQKQVIALR